MPGRLAQGLEPEELLRLFHARAGDLADAKPRWNCAPTMRLMAVRRDPQSGENALDLLRWGLVPHYAKDLKGGAGLINARSESVATTAPFRDAWAKKRRCLIPVNGWYEWTGEAGSKQPFAIALKSKEPMALAGLWENWKDPASGKWLRSFTVLTTSPNDLIAKIHHRMPVIVLAEDRERWLSGEEVIDLLNPIASDNLTFWSVSTAVNKVGNDGEELWEATA
jgi:putative SOS response-associated peptidase YedK